MMPAGRELADEDIKNGHETGFVVKIMEVEPTVMETEEDTQSKDTWSMEKEELLRTYPGWFVAYQDGKRVALEA